MVPINTVKVFLNALHAAFLLFAGMCCCEIQSSPKTLDNPTGKTC